jgi:hypothetical protein
VRQGLVCRERLEDGDEELDDAEVEAAANEFRHARELLTAEAMEAWLAERSLTTKAWMGACPAVSALPYWRREG